MYKLKLFLKISMRGSLNFPDAIAIYLLKLTFQALDKSAPSCKILLILGYEYKYGVKSLIFTNILFS